MDCCRVDLDGNTNDVHDIHKRAMMAAEIINMRHGWKQPKEIRDMRREEIVDFCEYTLQKMQEFDIDFYFKMLRMKGYEVTPRYDKDKKLVGYTIGKNASVFKASPSEACTGQGKTFCTNSDPKQPSCPSDFPNNSIFPAQSSAECPAQANTSQDRFQYRYWQ